MKHAGRGPTPDAAAPLRCDAAQRALALRTAHALGVPRDYGRTRALRLQREPRELAPIGTDVHGRVQWLEPRAARAFLRMRADALDDGVALEVVSAFRSASYQLGILQRKRERGESIAQILAVSAAPGYSEHHTGRALDLTTPGYPALEQAFEDSPAFAWLMREAGRFRFNLSYPRDNPHGIAYEPWHWCWRSR